MGISDRSGAVKSWEWMELSYIESSMFVWGLAGQPVGCRVLQAAGGFSHRASPLAWASPPLMSSRHRTLEPYGRWHATIYSMLVKHTEMLQSGAHLG